MGEARLLKDANVRVAVTRVAQHAVLRHVVRLQRHRCEGE